MHFIFVMNKLRFLLPLALGLATPIFALESRQWTSTAGGSIEAELVRVDGDKVILKDKTGRELTVKRAQLSQGDLRYIAEFGPKEGNTLGQAAAKPGATPNPGKEAKIDQKTFVKRTTTFTIPQSTFQVLETPHFLVMHPDKVDAADVGETAERMWLDMAFFHPGFAQKFKDRRMAIFLVDDEYTYDNIGKWYAEMIKTSGAPNAEASAAGLLATWSKAAASNVGLTQEIADENHVLRHARVFRTSTGTDKKKEKIKGVFVPFRLHCLAADMLNIHTGGVQGFGSKGLFAISTGHAYYKEILLGGRSETNMLREDGGTAHAVSSVGGFDPSKNWPDEIKKLLRRDKLTPDIQKLYDTNQQGAQLNDNVLAYAFSRYLQSNTDRVANYSKLLEKIDTSSQIPEPADLAKLYGFADVAAMQADWITYMKSSEFK